MKTIALALVGTVLLAGCGSSSGGGTSSTGGGTSSSGGALVCEPGSVGECVCMSGEPASKACLDDGSGFGSCECSPTLCGLAVAPGSDFCAGAAAPIDCAQLNPAFHAQVCGVGVLDPTMELSRSAMVEEFGGSGPPDLSCLAPDGYPKPGAPGTAKVNGVVRIFSHGCESKSVTIELHTVTRSGASADPDLGPIIGSAVITPSSCQAAGVASPSDDCGTRYECTYSYPGVPTETELVALTKGDVWTPNYEFNLYIPNGEVTGGTWKHDLRALASDDYSVFAQAALGGPVSPGHGMLLGEVHDCGNVRLEGAVVNTDVAKKALTYFTNNEEHPLPNAGATSTGTTGLFGAIDVAPGPASVAALGLVGGEVTTVGYFRARVFPDAVSSVTLRGVRPFQVP